MQNLSSLPEPVYEKRGYLDRDFRLFYLTGVPEAEIHAHYHDFDKIILFLSGQAGYFAEGRTYDLMPSDVVYIAHGEIHRPLVQPGALYERIVAYLSPGFLSSLSAPDCSLTACFSQAASLHSSVLRIRTEEKSPLHAAAEALKQACLHDGYANELYIRLLFLQWVVQLNRAVLPCPPDCMPAERSASRIPEITEFIHSHLSWDLNIDMLADTFYISKYHMMRMFRQETGCTIGDYITSKRLLLARELMARDVSMTQICYLCGFKNYSTFYRAYRRYFKEPPGKFRKSAD